MLSVHVAVTSEADSAFDRLHTALTNCFNHSLGTYQSKTVRDRPTDEAINRTLSGMIPHVKTTIPRPPCMRQPGWYGLIAEPLYAINPILPIVLSKKLIVWNPKQLQNNLRGKINQYRKTHKKRGDTELFELQKEFETLRNKFSGRTPN